MTDKKRETLEIEDEDARLKRIQSTLEKLNTTSTSSPSPANPFPLPTERSKPHAIPPSDLLARVQAFLPTLEASNALLEQQRQADPASLDIENVGDDAERYIEMNLGLGLFEQRRAGDTAQDSDSSSSDSSSDSSDSDSEETDSMDVQPENNAVRVNSFELHLP
ncbi:hypothetical protein C0991_002077 [Blastosporella zonata]|nr:hypothetical protein C0991_002077 [Blastosporella zonata]